MKVGLPSKMLYRLNAEYNRMKLVSLGNQPLERGLNRTNKVISKATLVLMKLTCGPVTTHTDGVIKNPDGTEMINKNVVLNANYSNNKEDNNFSIWTPQAKLEFQLTNPACDIFAPGKKYKISIEEWPEEQPIQA